MPSWLPSYTSVVRTYSWAAALLHSTDYTYWEQQFTGMQHKLQHSSLLRNLCDQCCINIASVSLSLCLAPGTQTHDKSPKPSHAAWGNDSGGKTPYALTRRKGPLQTVHKCEGISEALQEEQRSGDRRMRVNWHKPRTLLL